jgi:hypothetical protein
MMSDTQHSLAAGGTITAGWLTLPDFAAQLGRSPRTIARYIDQGLPIIRVGRQVFVDPSAARLWFTEGSPRPQPSRRRRAA